jgi:hypothetical protein
MESGTGLDDTGAEKFSIEKLCYAILAYFHHIWRSSSKTKEPLEGESKVVDGELDANGQHDTPERRRVVILVDPTKQS